MLILLLRLWINGVISKLPIIISKVLRLTGDWEFVYAAAITNPWSGTIKYVTIHFHRTSKKNTQHTHKKTYSKINQPAGNDIVLVLSLLWRRFDRPCSSEILLVFISIARNFNVIYFHSVAFLFLAIFGQNEYKRNPTIINIIMHSFAFKCVDCWSRRTRQLCCEWRRKKTKKNEKIGKFD